jgi:hypothetical protein
MGKSHARYFVRYLFYLLAKWRVRRRFYYLPLDAAFIT